MGYRCRWKQIGRSYEPEKSKLTDEQLKIISEYEVIPHGKSKFRFQLGSKVHKCVVANLKRDAFNNYNYYTFNCCKDFSFIGNEKEWFLTMPNLECEPKFCHAILEID